MAFNDEENPKKLLIAKTEPHKDLMANVAFFNRITGRININHPDFKWEVQDASFDFVWNPESERYESVRRVKEYKVCLFRFLEKGIVRWTDLSFHQSNSVFRKACADFLNWMGALGMITKAGHHPKMPSEQDHIWDRFTPQK